MIFVNWKKNGSLMINVDGQNVVVCQDDVEIISEDIPGWLVANEGRLTVALDITLTEDLRNEGLARELVNRIQNLRKAKNFEITDRIIIKVSANPVFDEAIKDYDGYIKIRYWPMIFYSLIIIWRMK